MFEIYNIADHLLDSRKSEQITKLLQMTSSRDEKDFKADANEGQIPFMLGETGGQESSLLSHRFTLQGDKQSSNSKR